MKLNPHERAIELSAKALVVDLDDDEQNWLEQHLSECPACVEEIALRKNMMSEMRIMPMLASESLVRSTQLHVRERCMQLRLRETRMQPIWISCGLASAWTLFSTPFLWEEFDALGHMMRVPDLLWQMAFLVTWFTPAMMAAAVGFWLRPMLVTGTPQQIAANS